MRFFLVGIQNLLKKEWAADLSHVLWIGGPPDAGKTTVARLLAKRHKLRIYQYDKSGLRHYKQLARHEPKYQAFLEASFEEWWVKPEPEEAWQWLQQTAWDRFPLVVRDLMELPGRLPIVAEGIGLLPNLVGTVISSRRQAIWLAPTAAFMADAMRRRRKLRYGRPVSDTEEARSKMLALGKLAADDVKHQARAKGFELIEIDGGLSPEAVSSLIKYHFGPFLHRYDNQ